MSPPAIAIIDAVNSLLEADLNSIFRFMARGSPYLEKAGAEIRQPLAEMAESVERQANELAQVVERLGGVPAPVSRARAEEQYLAYLSLKFLLPKLVDAKKLCLRRYENTLAAIRADAPRWVIDVLEQHLKENRHHLLSLEEAAATLAPARAPQAGQ